MKLISILLILLTGFSGFSQIINYTPTFVCNLSDTTLESSGLIYVNKTLWTHNDSGGKPVLYQTDTLTGFVKRTVKIKNTTNIDWEDLAQSTTHIYIGDFGNNYGNRTNLRIYRISKLDLLNPINDSILADTIKFHYQDQTVFTSTLNATNYDGEAFIFKNDSLHLFSKSWLTQNTKHYILPATIGNHTAVLVDSIYVDGLITSAGINQINGNIVLLGYKKVGFNYNCFAWLFYNYTSHNYFKSNKKRLELGVASTLGQTEGIVVKNDNSGYFSSEKIVTSLFTIPPQLYKFNFNSYFTTTGVNEINNNLAFKVYPNPTKENIIVDLPNSQTPFTLKLFNINGENVYHELIVEEKQKIINLKRLVTGIYFLKLENAATIFTQKIIIE
jgi:hypothetical protein